MFTDNYSIFFLKPDLGVASLFVFVFVIDGLYVLLRPETKRKKQTSASGDGCLDHSRIPPHLKQYAVTKAPPETCPWSLSGPQFPKPTAIQQRYCYPKGNPEYASRKGGALWTMYGRDGKEDLEYRLLHVYFSAKRAVNKGISIPDEEVQAATLASNHTIAGISTPSPHKKRNFKRKKVRGSPSYHHHHFGYDLSTSPASLGSATTHVSSSSSTISSPLPHQGGISGRCSPQFGLDLLSLPPPSPYGDCQRARRQRHRSCQSIFVSPNTAVSTPEDQHLHNEEIMGGRGFHPVLSFENPDHDKPSPFRPNRLGHTAKAPELPYQSSEIDDRRDDHSSLNHCGQDPFPCDMDESSLHSALDSYWNDPLFALVMKPSVEYPTNKECTVHESALGIPPSIADPHALKARLHNLHACIREGILNAPQRDQGSLLSIFSSWARCIAKSPLSDLPRHDHHNNLEPGDLDSEIGGIADTPMEAV